MKSFIQVTAGTGETFLLSLDEIQGVYNREGIPTIETRDDIYPVRESYKKVVALIASIAKVAPFPETKPPRPPAGASVQLTSVPRL